MQSRIERPAELVRRHDGSGRVHLANAESQCAASRPRIVQRWDSTEVSQWSMVSGQRSDQGAVHGLAAGALAFS